MDALDWIRRLSATLNRPAQQTPVPLPEKRGWLSLNGKRFWFSLKGGRLSFFPSEHATTGGKRFNLSECHVKKVVSPFGLVIEITREKKAGKYVLMADRPADIDLWFACVSVSARSARDEDEVLGASSDTAGADAGASGAVFAAALRQVLANPKLSTGLLPNVVRDCLAHLNTHAALNTPNLFAQDVDARKLAPWVAAYNNGVRPFSPNAPASLIACLLKLYLKLLPVPLISEELHAELHAARNNPLAVRRIVGQMGQDSRFVLRCLCDLLNNVAFESKQEGNTAVEIATVFAPLIMWRRGRGSEAADEDMYVLRSIMVTGTLVLHYSDVFDDPDDQHHHAEPSLARSPAPREEPSDAPDAGEEEQSSTFEQLIDELRATTPRARDPARSAGLNGESKRPAPSLAEWAKQLRAPPSRPQLPVMFREAAQEVAQRERDDGLGALEELEAELEADKRDRRSVALSSPSASLDLAEAHQMQAQQGLASAQFVVALDVTTEHGAGAGAVEERWLEMSVKRRMRESRRSRLSPEQMASIRGRLESQMGGSRISAPPASPVQHVRSSSSGSPAAVKKLVSALEAKHCPAPVAEAAETQRVVAPLDADVAAAREQVEAVVARLKFEVLAWAESSAQALQALHAQQQAELRRLLADAQQPLNEALARLVAATAPKLKPAPAPAPATAPEQPSVSLTDAEEARAGRRDKKDKKDKKRDKPHRPGRSLSPPSAAEVAASPLAQSTPVVSSRPAPPSRVLSASDLPPPPPTPAPPAPVPVTSSASLADSSEVTLSLPPRSSASVTSVVSSPAPSPAPPAHEASLLSKLPPPRPLPRPGSSIATATLLASESSAAVSNAPPAPAPQPPSPPRVHFAPAVPLLVAASAPSTAPPLPQPSPNLARLDAALARLHASHSLELTCAGPSAVQPGSVVEPGPVLLLHGPDDPQLFVEAAAVHAATRAELPLLVTGVTRLGALPDHPLPFRKLRLAASYGELPTAIRLRFTLVRSEQGVYVPTALPPLFTEPIQLGPARSAASSASAQVSVSGLASPQVVVSLSSERPALQQQLAALVRCVRQMSERTTRPEALGEAEAQGANVLLAARDLVVLQRSPASDADKQRLMASSKTLGVTVAKLVRLYQEETDEQGAEVKAAELRRLLKEAVQSMLDLLPRFQPDGPTPAPATAAALSASPLLGGGSPGRSGSGSPRARAAGEVVIPPRPPREYSYEELWRDGDRKRSPPGCDIAALEIYLPDVEFERLFRMDRTAFYSLPPWRQRQLKVQMRMW